MNALFVVTYLYNCDNDILLLRRCNTTFNGLYSLPGGKVDPHETALQVIKRETKEEVALDLPESAFELAHTMHRKGTETEFIALCFKAYIGIMNPHNKEPQKCDSLKFFNPNHLPTHIIPAHKQIIECIKKRILYSEHGW